MKWVVERGTWEGCLSDEEEDGNEETKEVTENQGKG